MLYKNSIRFLGEVLKEICKQSDFTFYIHLSSSWLYRTMNRIGRFHMTSRRPWWCTKLIRRELNSIFMHMLSFVSVIQYGSWSREWTRSLPRFTTGPLRAEFRLETNNSSQPNYPSNALLKPNLDHVLNMFCQTRFQRVFFLNHEFWFWGLQI